MHDTSQQILEFYHKKVALPSEERTKMRERRNTNRQRLKDGLEANGKPKPYGSWSQGSYAMHTMIQDGDNDYDIDDGAYFRKEVLVGPKGAEMTALDVRQMVCDALQDDRFSRPPDLLKNCVRVYYNEGFHVDVPSYREITKKDEWTGQEIKQYELASAEWKSSDPREVTKWFKRQNRNISPDYEDSEGQYLRIVKLMKMFSRSRPSWKGKIATGFMITKLVSDHFHPHPGRDDASLRDVMRHIEARIQKDIDHPTLAGGEVISDADDPRLPFLRERLRENIPHLDVLDDLECTHMDAMGAWDKVFNTTWFSEQPEPNGAKRFFVGSSPNAPVQKQGGGRYG